MIRIAIAFILFSAAYEAAACSFEPRSDEQLFAAAKTIFRARVTEARLSKLDGLIEKGKSIEIVEAKYDVLEVFKGVPPPSGVVRDVTFGPGNCGLGILVGTEYVFMPEEHDMVLAPSGSFGYFNAEGTQVKPRLELFRRLARPNQK